MLLLRSRTFNRFTSSPSISITQQRSFVSKIKMNQPNFPAYNPPPPPVSNGPNWKNALVRIVSDIEHNRSSIFAETDSLLIVYDAYPKSNIHLLILPKTIAGPHNVSQLTKEHLPILKDMDQVANQLVEQFVFQA